MFKHLTDKDLKDGKELIQILEDLPESDMKQIIIYASALKDRQLVENSSRKAGQKGDRKKSEKRKKAYRSHLSDNNYMPYAYCDIVKKGNKSYKVGSYIFIYACFSVR